MTAQGSVPHRRRQLSLVGVTPPEVFVFARYAPGSYAVRTGPDHLDRLGPDHWALPLGIREGGPLVAGLGTRTSALCAA